MMTIYSVKCPVT